MGASRQPARDYWPMVTVGVVLSAGGHYAAAHHAGVLDALASTTGWDPRRADVVVGTSAGAVMAVCLRAGLSAADLAAYYNGEPLSPEGQDISNRVTTRLHVPDSSLRPKTPWPAKPMLVAREIFVGGRPRPMVAIAGVLPEGEVDGSSFAERAEQLHPDPWPTLPTWLCAVDLDSGQRVIFGRDDVDTTVGPAVQASSAIPGYFVPVEINGRRYVDGGIHSNTNADVLAPLHLDLVVVSTSKTVPPSVDRRSGGSLALAWHGRTLRREIERIAAKGTTVLVLQPTAGDISSRGPWDMDTSTTADVYANGKDSALARLAHPDALAGRQLLEKRATES